MKQCIKCESVKFEFQFFKDHPYTTDVCKQCAWVLASIGVNRYQHFYKRMGRRANTMKGWKIVEGL